LNRGEGGDGSVPGSYRRDLRISGEKRVEILYDIGKSEEGVGFLEAWAVTSAKYKIK